MKTKNDSVVVRFKYDATGNRIEKRVEKYDTTLVTRYVRDASGNVMGIYGDTTVLELPIYGSLRTGMFRGEVLEGDQTLGRRNYELSNHLGNVLSVITDNIGMSQNDSTWANISSVRDYYPFGLDMNDRSWTDSTMQESRLGFNGKEKDSSKEWGNTAYDYGFRVYNPSIAKFLRSDPIAKNYPHSSPYAFAENSPIQAIDLEGLEKYKVTGRSFIPMKTLENPWYTPNFSASSFAGDDRTSYQLNTTDFRTEQKVNVDFDNRSVSYSNNIASGTKALDKVGKVIETSEAGPAGPAPTFGKSFLENGNSVTIHLSIDAPNKLVAGAPAINYQFDVTITPSADKKSFDYQITGATDGFPAYELWITDETNNKSYLLLNSNPIESNETPRALFPPMENTYNLKGNSKSETPAEKVDFKDKKNTPKK